MQEAPDATQATRDNPRCHPTKCHEDTNPPTAPADHPIKDVSLPTANAECPKDTNTPAALTEHEESMAPAKNASGVENANFLCVILNNHRTFRQIIAGQVATPGETSKSWTSHHAWNVAASDEQDKQVQDLKRLRWHVETGCSPKSSICEK
jgi:hypothetical protein